MCFLQELFFYGFLFSQKGFLIIITLFLTYTVNYYIFQNSNNYNIGYHKITVASLV